MSDEDEHFGGSLVLDFRKWWRHVKTIYSCCTPEILHKAQGTPRNTLNAQFGFTGFFFGIFRACLISQIFKGNICEATVVSFSRFD